MAEQANSGPEPDRLGIEYRLYFLDPAGHIVGREEFEATTDEVAVAYAKQYVDGKALELWAGARVVARIAPEKK